LEQLKKDEEEHKRVEQLKKDEETRRLDEQKKKNEEDKRMEQRKKQEDELKRIEQLKKEEERLSTVTVTSIALAPAPAAPALPTVRAHGLVHDSLPHTVCLVSLFAGLSLSCQAAPQVHRDSGRLFFFALRHLLTSFLSLAGPIEHFLVRVPSHQPF
jgi:ATPase subunit of ABC transporter with duplicated ATPase domains